MGFHASSAPFKEWQTKEPGRIMTIKNPLKISIQSKEYLRRLFSKLIYLQVLQQLLQIHKTCCTSQHVHPEQPSRNDTMQVTRPFTFYSGAVLRQGALSGMHTCDQMGTRTHKLTLLQTMHPQFIQQLQCDVSKQFHHSLPLFSPKTPPIKICSPIPTNRTNQNHHLCDQRFLDQVPFVQR